MIPYERVHRPARKPIGGFPAKGYYQGCLDTEARYDPLLEQAASAVLALRGHVDATGERWADTVAKGLQAALEAVRKGESNG